MKYFFLLILFAAGTLCGSNLIVTSGHSCKSHLQGIAADETGIYWSFTQELIKTDYQGRFLAKAPLFFHTGDICMVDGEIYTATDYRPQGDRPTQSAVCRYGKDLKLKQIYPIYPANIKIEGITFYKGKFYIGVGGNNPPHRKNDILVCDREMKILKRITVDIGVDTRFGVQNLCVVNDMICGGFYAKSDGVLFAPETLEIKGTFPLTPTEGIAKVPEKYAGNNDTWFLAHSVGKRGDYKGRVRVYKITNGKRTPVPVSSLKLPR